MCEAREHLLMFLEAVGSEVGLHNADLAHAASHGEFEPALAKVTTYIMNQQRRHVADLRKIKATLTRGQTG